MEKGGALVERMPTLHVGNDWHTSTVDTRDTATRTAMPTNDGTT